jgi:hypothetical protein
MSVQQENRNRARIINANNATDDARILREAASMSRAPRVACATPMPAINRHQIRAWMRANAADYDYCATSLTEAANAALTLPSGAMNDSSHWIWDEAYKATDI